MSTKLLGNTGLSKLITLIKTLADTKQDTLTAGDGISISNNVISATSDAILQDTVTISSDNTSTINIPFTIESTANLLVYHNGILLVPGTHYTATTTAITLSGYTANSGDIMTFMGSSVLPAYVNTAINDAMNTLMEGDY